MGWALFLVAAAYVFYTPFTKVEESFNIQATHDILYLKQNFSQYDHHEFPGVVPRSFIGPLILSILSSPIIMLLDFLDIPKFFSQYVVRLILAALVVMSWNNFRKTVIAILGKGVGFWFTALTISQFHFVFYMSRTLPNILVLPIVLLALSAWLRKQHARFIWLAGISILIFRSELLMFFGILLLYNLFYNEIKIKSFLQTALLAGFITLTATICIDSFFWNRLIWPEGEVLWYNTILNKSSNWGTSPFLWYFYSAIPRGMGFSTVFIPLGLYFETRIRPLGIGSLIFVFLYSMLPHKELRFVIYIFPILNVCAACYCNTTWRTMNKSTIRKLKAFICLGHVLLNIGFTMFLLFVSSTNYPGGESVRKLHKLDNSPHRSLHISNLVAQTGLTRFLQNKNWNFNKTEHMEYTEYSIEQFDYLLVEENTKSAKETETIEKYFIPIENVYCFNYINIQYKYFSPVKIETKPCVTIYKRKIQPTREPKEIDYEGLRKMALENKKEFRNSKVMWRIVEEYYNTKLRKLEKKVESVKTVQKQEEIKTLIDNISKLDLTKYCDFEKVHIKECLKYVIDIVEE